VPRTIFVTQHDAAELAAFEREGLRELSRLIPTMVWGLVDAGSTLPRIERAERILSLIERRPDTQYLHDILTRARDAETRSWPKPQNRTSDRRDAPLTDRAVSTLSTALRACGGRGLPIVIRDDDGRDYRLNTLEVELNTTLRVGADPLRLAAKVYGWAEANAWISEPDRSWAADLIERGLRDGLYRPGVWSPAQDNAADEGTWIESGWADVQRLLRGGTGPVVLTTSATDDFPNPGMDSWAVPWPEDVPRRFDALTPEQREAHRRRSAEWSTLTPEQRWEHGVREITENLSELQISPSTLRTATFGPNVTLFDLFARDSVYRVATRFFEFEERFGPWNG
jgi:hypothetical protein